MSTFKLTNPTMDNISNGLLVAFTNFKVVNLLPQASITSSKTWAAIIKSRIQ